MALLLLSLAAMACGGRVADPDGPPPSRKMEAGPNREFPRVPGGFIPRTLVYEARRYKPDLTYAEGVSMMLIDHRELPGQPRWRLSDGPRQAGFGAVAHLTSDLQLAWLEDMWRRPVRLRREGAELVGEEVSMGGADSLRIPLPPGAPFHTDLSLLFLMATWPIAPGWEERGMMSEGRGSFRVVPVRIRVVGEETLSTRLGVVDCWIVVVHGPPDGRRAPHWYWVSKRDRIVIMRRHYLPEAPGGFDEHLLRQYREEPDVMIDVVVAGPPRFDAGPIVAVELALAPGNYILSNSSDDDTLYRFAVSAHSARHLTSSDSAAIGRLLDSAGYRGRYRIEPPTDRSYVRIPRRPLMN